MTTDIAPNNENAHHPIKPLKQKGLKRKNKRSHDRAFGKDLTNQQRESGGIDGLPSKKGKYVQRDDKFSFSKPQISVKPEAESVDAEPVYVEMEAITNQPLPPWDEMDVDDDLCVTEYIGDIIASLKTDEVLYRPKDYMEEQKDLNPRIRAILVDWLVEVHKKFSLLPPTYFLAINLLDRYLERKQLKRKKLQLCGLYTL